MPPINIDDLDGAMTVSEASDKLGYSYKHMLRLIKAGHIESVRLGGGNGRILITNRALNEYLYLHRNTGDKGSKPGRNRR